MLFRSFLFKHCGQLLFAPGTNEEKLLEVALESGAEDVITHEDGSLEVITDPFEFSKIRGALEGVNLKPEFGEVTMRPGTDVDLNAEQSEAMQKLLDALENLDDVQAVYTNANT